MFKLKHQTHLLFIIVFIFLTKNHQLVLSLVKSCLVQDCVKIQSSELGIGVRRSRITPVRAVQSFGLKFEPTPVRTFRSFGLKFEPSQFGVFEASDLSSNLSPFRVFEVSDLISNQPPFGVFKVSKVTLFLH